MAARSEIGTDVSKRLISAAASVDLAAVEELLAGGASAKFVDDPPGVWGSCDTKTALHAALATARGGRPDAERVVLALVRAGADVNAVRAQFDWRGCGVRESAFDMLLTSSLSASPSVLEAFLAAGADANTKNVSERHSMRTDGRTVSRPLHTAVRRASPNVVGVLLRAGAHVDAPYTERYDNERGHNQDLSVTALHQAIDRRDGNLEMVLLLLAEGADPNAIASRLVHEDSGRVGTTDDPRAEGYESPIVCVRVKETPLHRALLAGHAEVVKALLAAGADRSIARTHGDTQESTEALAARAEHMLADKLPRGALTAALHTAAGWTPDNHKFFSSSLRERVRTVLLVAKAADWALPDDALYQIFAALAARPAADGAPAC